QEYLTQLDADIKITFKIRNEVKNIGFELNISDFDAKMNGFMETKDHLIAKITKFNFDTILEPSVREQLHGEITELDTQITQFKDIIEEKFTFISEIIALKDNNSKLIEVTKILIDGARDEKDSIIKLYELSEIKQLTKIDDEIKLFNSFLDDYDKLIEIIYSAREDYASLKSRITQANKFLIRVIKNLEVSIKELKAIRSDELSCRERIIDFDLKVVEIDLYIRKYQHTYKTSSYINAMIEEFSNKLTLLKKELNNEPLNITTVRNLNDSVASIINKLIDEELEKNIKQRIGSELILKYISRFNKSEGMDTTIGRLNNLYSGHEYKSLLQEGYQILLNADSIKGPAIYKGIVSEVTVDPFNEILSVVSTESNTKEVLV
ncbi:MAG: septation ring formation regulator EzrA, partial [Mycoplasmatales bacterium]